MSRDPGPCVTLMLANAAIHKDHERSDMYATFFAARHDVTRDSIIA